MKRMLDLFAGRLGWAIAFLERGWEVVAVDLVAPPNLAELRAKYPQLRFMKCNVLDVSINQGYVELLNEYGMPELFLFDFICASSPCEQFSVHGMKHFHPNPPYPELGIKLFEHTRALCEASGVPYVMENVRAAQQFVGNAQHHCGPFYLWGNGVPAILNQGIIKGMTRKAHGFREYKGQPGWNKHQGLETRDDKKQAALAATIPPELSSCVADYAERLLEQKACEVTP